MARAGSGKFHPGHLWLPLTPTLRMAGSHICIRCRSTTFCEMASGLCATMNQGSQPMAKRQSAAPASISARLEKTIEKDFQSCKELLRAGADRNLWVEDNCKRMKSWQEAAEAGDARGQLLYGLCFHYGHAAANDDVKCFTASSGRGNPQGQLSLGRFYRFGPVERFTKAAEQDTKEDRTPCPSKRC